MHFLAHTALLAIVSSSLASVIEVPRAITPRAAATDEDCAWAGKYAPYTYLSCTSTLNSPDFFVQTPTSKPNYYLTYKILMQGTGQDIQNWCAGIVGKIQEMCGRRAIQNYSCKINDDWNNNVLDGDNNWSEVRAPGMEMDFDLWWGGGSTFSATDHDHDCMAKAIAAGTCPNIDIFNGPTCISDTWVAPAPGDDSDGEEIIGPGPPIDGLRDQ